MDRERRHQLRPPRLGNEGDARLLRDQRRARRRWNILAGPGERLHRVAHSRPLRRLVPHARPDREPAPLGRLELQGHLQEPHRQPAAHPLRHRAALPRHPGALGPARAGLQVHAHLDLLEASPPAGLLGAVGAAAPAVRASGRFASRIRDDSVKRDHIRTWPPTSPRQGKVRTAAAAAARVDIERFMQLSRADVRNPSVDGRGSSDRGRPSA